MKKCCRHLLLGLALILSAGLTEVTICGAEEWTMQGWGINDPYNKYYDVRKFNKFRAWVVDLKSEPPMHGMSPGTIMVVRDGSRVIDVHLCPTWFAKPGDVGIKKGDRVKIKGCRATIDGKDVFMASKVKKENYFELKVRKTEDGQPFWAMTPEEIVRERFSENDD
jgi:hypothetical protein